jgi:hypothetical protein
VWIASRKDLMSGTFGMLTLWALLGSFHGGVRRERVACAVLFFLMACFSKAASVTFVVLVGLIIFSSLPRLGAHDRRVALLYGCVFREPRLDSCVSLSPSPLSRCLSSGRLALVGVGSNGAVRSSGGGCIRLQAPDVGPVCVADGASSIFLSTVCAVHYLVAR